MCAHLLCMQLLPHWKLIREGQEERRTRRMSFLICTFFRPCGSVLVSCLLLGTQCLWGVLVVFIAWWRRRRRRRRAHGASFTIIWKFPARSRIWWTLYSAPGLIPAVPRESRSVTEQITVYCFLSRLDQPALNSRSSHSTIHGRVRCDGAPMRPPDLWTPSIRSRTQITWLHAWAAKDRSAGWQSMSTYGWTQIKEMNTSIFLMRFLWKENDFCWKCAIF